MEQRHKISRTVSTAVVVVRYITMCLTGVLCCISALTSCSPAYIASERVCTYAFVYNLACAAIASILHIALVASCLELFSLD